MLWIYGLREDGRKKTPKKYAETSDDRKTVGVTITDTMILYGTCELYY